MVWVSPSLLIEHNINYAGWPLLRRRPVDGDSISESPCHSAPGKAFSARRLLQTLDHGTCQAAGIRCMSGYPGAKLIWGREGIEILRHRWFQGGRRWADGSFDHDIDAIPFAMPGQRPVIGCGAGGLRSTGDFVSAGRKALIQVSATPDCTWCKCWDGQEVEVGAATALADVLNTADREHGSRSTCVIEIYQQSSGDIPCNKGMAMPTAREAFTGLVSSQTNST
jgi:hypothetical protein